MIVRSSSGFTIIETVLFLGITGLMILGLMIGVGASVNAQRYKDASESFKSLIQAQYSNSVNVQNGRTANWVCNNVAAVIPDAATVPAGQSDCMMLGKYIRIEGGNVNSYTVLAREKSGVTPSDTTKKMSPAIASTKTTSMIVNPFTVCLTFIVVSHLSMN